MLTHPCNVHFTVFNLAVYITFLPAVTLVLKLLTGDFAVFRPAGATRSTDYRQIWYIEGKRKSHTLCQISRRSVHIWGFLAQKT